VSDRPIVDARGLHKHFGPQHVLKGVDRVVAGRERVFLTGPSGSGKPTLLRCLNRQEEASSGAVVAAGIDPPDRRTGINLARQRIGMVSRSFALNPRMIALGNVTLAPREVARKPRAEAAAIGMAALERVGLADRAHHTPAQLSGGRQRRVAIAPQPRAMLFGEPIGAPDPELVGGVLAVMAHDLPRIAQGFVLTAELAVLVVITGIAAVLALAMLRSRGTRPLNQPIVFYVDPFRALPSLVQ